MSTLFPQSSQQEEDDTEFEELEDVPASEWTPDKVGQAMAMTFLFISFMGLIDLGLALLIIKVMTPWL